jgi:hypothetical protein
MQKELIIVPRATLDVYNYQDNGLNIYEFNATKCSPPEPMVNAIVVLEMLKNENDRLIVMFFHEPLPLYERLLQTFTHESKELESGDIMVTFKKIYSQL